MGLDGVELILAVEERFQISLLDEKVGNVVTVGDLYALVLSKLGAASAAGCATSVAFYRTRCALAAIAGVERRSIRPATPLAPLLSGGVRERWGALSRSTGLNLPGLRRPAWTPWACLSAGAAVMAAAGQSFGSGIAALAAASGVALLAPQIGGRLPRDVRTVGDLARELAIRNRGQLAAATPPDEREVWGALVQVFVEETRIEAEAVRPEAGIVSDLGID